MVVQKVKCKKEAQCIFCLLLAFITFQFQSLPIHCLLCLLELNLLSIFPLLVGLILSSVYRGQGDTKEEETSSSSVLFLVLLCGCQGYEWGGGATV